MPTTRLPSSSVSFAAVTLATHWSQAQTFAFDAAVVQLGSFSSVLLGKVAAAPQLEHRLVGVKKQLLQLQLKSQSCLSRGWSRLVILCGLGKGGDPGTHVCHCVCASA